MKIIRDYKVSDEINRLELEWWDKNATLVERVWQLDKDISWNIRKYYLKKAKRFLSEKKKQVRILELGCGSGWVGQMIAGENIRITGIDFSKSQIELAKNNAKKNKVDAFCDYHTIDALEYLFNKDIDGILIHCFLHHLDGEELISLFNLLKTKFKRGIKVWIYEPAFHVCNENCNSNYTELFIYKLAANLVAYLSKKFKKYDLIDTEVLENFNILNVLAQDNEWYLTPKEIPFDILTFEEEYGRYINVKNSYWATIFIIGWVFETNLIKNNFLRKFLIRIIVPFLSFLDERLCKKDDYLSKKIIAPIYAFHVWECILE